MGFNMLFAYRTDLSLSITNNNQQEYLSMNTASHSGKRQHRPLVLALRAALAAGLALPLTPAFAAETTRVSVDSAGAEGNNGGGYYRPSFSADGRYVTFQSWASNLVANDTNEMPDIFVRDRSTGQTTRVSVDNAGNQGNNESRHPAISADGRYVAFQSEASNLVAGDTNNHRDIFVHDRTTGQTTRVSVSSTGAQGNNNSGGFMSSPAISADGRYVAFTSWASNLVANDTNGWDDIFVHDRWTGQITRVSVDSAGNQGNYPSGFASISAAGRYVAFMSFASNLVAGDTNGAKDIFVHDRTTGQTTRVSVDSAGNQGSLESRYPAISADGRYVAFQSKASNLVANDTGWEDIFVHDRTTSQTTRVSVDSTGAQSNGMSYFSSISADGRFVAFQSLASNLVANDTNGKQDIFVHDRTANQTTRMSVDSAGAQGNDRSRLPSINANGRYVAFESDASNLVTGDLNTYADIFVHDRLLNPANTADLQVTQTVSAYPVPTGSTFSYTATVKNLGPGNAGSVILTDLAPLVDQVSLPVTLTPSQGSCIKGPISICRLGTLNAGQQATVQVTFTALQVGIATNSVSVSAAPQDPQPLNNAAVTSTTISSP
jgi:uncharacterized repeat protein (TIGR01451 family)